MSSGTQFQLNEKGQGNLLSKYMTVLCVTLAFYLLIFKIWIVVSALLLSLIYWMTILIYKITRRITRTDDLPDNCAGMWLSGRVTAVSEGDGFRFFHCPWFGSTRCIFADDQLYVRLAGIDATEMGKQHMPKEPIALSKEYLRNLIEGKDIKIKVVGKDKKKRVLAFAYLPGSLPTTILDCFLPLKFLYTNVNLEMVENGYACVYRGRGAMYDEYEKILLSLEEDARNERKGMWLNSNEMVPIELQLKFFLLALFLIIVRLIF